MLYAELGGRDGTNLGMAIIREHLAAKGLGLHCDLQYEHSIVGNNVGLLLMLNYGSDEQRAEELSHCERHHRCQECGSRRFSLRRTP